MASTSNQCQICFDNYTSKFRRPITCQACKQSFCARCFNTYLMQDDSRQECMACKVPLSTEFILMHSQRKFKEAYIKKIVNVWLFEEQALMEATRKRMHAIEQEHLLSSRLRAIHEHLTRFENDSEMKLLGYKYKAELKIHTAIAHQSDEELVGTSTSTPCIKNKCNGFIRNGKCSSCQKSYCTTCQEEQQEHHECNPNTVATLNLIKDDTKPCPKCKAPIHKIEGCDQMFCTKCKTPFSWNTSRLITGVIHNEYYQEYRTQLRTTSASMNNPCFDILKQLSTSMSPSQTKAYNLTVAQNPTANAIHKSDFVRKILVIQVEDIVRALTEETSDAVLHQKKRQLRELMISIHKDSFDKKQSDGFYAHWHSQLTLLFKRIQMKKDLIDILHLFKQLLTEIIITGLQSGNFDEMFMNILHLIKLMREQLECNENIHKLKNKTTITIAKGITCKLLDRIRYR
jgi:hypothetical protein